MTFSLSIIEFHPKDGRLYASSNYPVKLSNCVAMHDIVWYYMVLTYFLDMHWYYRSDIPNLCIVQFRLVQTESHCVTDPG